MLTSEQIDELYNFVEKKRVFYYDVQLELVDHLANAIEEKMAGNDKVSFEEALQQVYQAFGIFGFNTVVREKEEIAQRSTRRRFYELLKQQVSWPRKMMAACMSVLFFFVFLHNNETIAVALPVLLIVVLFIFEIIVKTKLGRIKRKTGKRLLLIQHFYTSSLVIFPVYILPAIGSLDRYADFFNTMPPVYSIIFGVFCSFIVLVSIAYYQTFNLINQEVREKYPSLFAEVN